MQGRVGGGGGGCKMANTDLEQFRFCDYLLHLVPESVAMNVPMPNNLHMAFSACLSKRMSLQYIAHYTEVLL